MNKYIKIQPISKIAMWNKTTFLNLVKDKDYYIVHSFEDGVGIVENLNNSFGTFLTYECLFYYFICNDKNDKPMNKQDIINYFKEWFMKALYHKEVFWRDEFDKALSELIKTSDYFQLCKTPEDFINFFHQLFENKNN